jgi:hypothetical protein
VKAIRVVLIALLLFANCRFSTRHQSAPSRISVANAERIEIGMTMFEIEELLGPARDETHGEIAPPPGTVTRPYMQEGGDKHWISQEVAITVRFSYPGERVARIWYWEDGPRSRHRGFWECLVWQWESALNGGTPPKK